VLSLLYDGEIKMCIIHTKNSNAKAPTLCLF